MKKLSIIIRCRNRLEYTIRSIVSIDEKSGLKREEDYEIICVDQASTDGTKEWILSVMREGYYPVRAVFLSKNIGDGLGMQEGINLAEGEFIAQHDNDIVLVTEDYYSKLIRIYEYLENINIKVCSLSGSHIQGLDRTGKTFQFAKSRAYSEEGLIIPTNYSHRDILYPVAWNTASFIFRKKFSDEIKFHKGMCNSWCGEWFDLGYENFICESIKFWHIDSDLNKTGAHIQKQYDKFPFYEYAFRHYSHFIKRRQNA